MKINGYTLPLKDIIVIVTVGIWLGALSFQGTSNADDIEKLAETPERLARIETTQKAQKEDIQEIKEEQKEQKKLLLKILEKVSE
jgi:hypothetical protein